MNKRELIDYMADNSDMTKVAAKLAIESFISAVSECLAESGKVQLAGFGTFEVRKRKARKGRNPATGKTIKIGPTTTVGFRASPKLKEGL